MAKIGIHSNGKAWIKPPTVKINILNKATLTIDNYNDPHYKRLERLISIGNKISHKPYIWSGGHGPPISTKLRGYDCSGAICTILHRQWFKGRTGIFSGFFVDGSRYDVGSRRPFRGYKNGSIVIFANDNHVWADIWWQGSRITFDNYGSRGSHSMWFNANAAVNRTSGYSNRYYRV